MPKSLLVFGNGLGRAIDNSFFSLQRALHAAWNDNDVLDEPQRQLIRRCLPEEVIEGDGAPTSEDDLDKLQQILAACDMINELETETDEGWLSKRGKSFPAAIRSYVHRAACEFHADEQALPEEFAQPLREFIVRTKSHVATLNYDKLLYYNFIGTQVFHGYSCLIDGFKSGRFSKENLDRQDTARTSYYLHLHGSPLFHDDEAGGARKAHVAEVDLLAGDRSGHIVLTNVKHKRSVISASPVLSAYWEKLDKALDEANSITVFGYSGFDDHLNKRVQKKLKQDSNTQLRIVERRAEGSPVERKEYWKEKLGDCELVRCKNILEFTDW